MLRSLLVVELLQRHEHDGRQGAASARSVVGGPLPEPLVTLTYVDHLVGHWHIVGFPMGYLGKPGVLSWVVTVHVSNQHAPEWRVAGEREHLIVERQFHDPGNAWAVLTGCGQIITPSARDIRLNEQGYQGKVPRCGSCEIVEPTLTNTPRAAF